MITLTLQQCLTKYCLHIHLYFYSCVLIKIFVFRQQQKSRSMKKLVKRKCRHLLRSYVKWVVIYINEVVSHWICTELYRLATRNRIRAGQQIHLRHPISANLARLLVLTLASNRQHIIYHIIYITNIIKKLWNLTKSECCWLRIRIETNSIAC